MQAVRHMMENTEDVGERFPEEARRIHYGEVAGARHPRPGHRARMREALRDEGIEVMALPVPAALEGPAAVGRVSALQHAAGVHQAVRVERLLDRAHQLQRHRRLALRQFVALERADAVLGRDRAAVRHHGVVDDAC